MANVLNRTTKEYLRSVNTPEYDVADWIINPDVSALAGVPTKYWVITGDTVAEMSQAEKDAVDAAELADKEAQLKAYLKARFDEESDNTKALGLLLLDLYNLIKANTPGNTLPTITPAQLKTRFETIVDGL